MTPCLDPSHGRQRPAAGLLLLLALAGVATAVNPSWYDCNASNCQPPSCMCASTNAPAGISPEDTPQFIILTHDDAINKEANAGIRSMTDKYKNPNGCKVGATWFVIKNGTDCKLAKQLYDEGHEIAMHTLDHYKVGPDFNAPSWNSKVPLDVEMIGVREWLNDTCGIPRDRIVGFRAPFLAYGPENREILYENGALYDSSMVESWTSGGTSPSPDKKLWPYSFDHGIPTDCSYFGNDTQCDQQKEKYPGLWEFPLYQLQDKSGTPLYAMDPSGDVYKVLRENFDPVYEGTRAPIGLYVHAPWTTSSNVAAANKFFDYAMAKGDVWMVTMHQAIQWMQNPVPKQQMKDWFKCDAGGVVASSTADVPVPDTLASSGSPTDATDTPAAASPAAGPAAVPAAGPTAAEAVEVVQQAPVTDVQPSAPTNTEAQPTEEPAMPAAVPVTAAPASTPPSTDSSSSSGGLSTGAIAGIAVGGAVAVAALAGVTLVVLKKKAAAAAAAAAVPAGAMGGVGASATFTTGGAAPKVANMA